MAKDNTAGAERLHYYRLIRAQTGLDFAGWGDDPQRWFDWLIHNGDKLGEDSFPEGQSYSVLPWDGDQRYILLRHDSYSTKRRPRGQILNRKRPSLSDVLDIATLQADGEWQPAPPVDPELLAHWAMEAYTETLTDSLHTLSNS